MPSYRLIFEGRIQPQTSRDEVQRRLAELYQVPVEEIELLFSNLPVVLKKDLDDDTAQKDKAEFEATGALCRLEAQPATAETEERRPLPDTAPAGSAPSPPTVDGRRYGLLHPYFLAFFSRDFYRDVIAHWRGLAFAHLLLVLVLSAAAYTIHFNSLIALFIAEEAPAILAQVPEILIEDGRVRVAVKEPYTIRHPESGTVLAVIDTTGEITSLGQTKALLLLTASRLAVRLDPDHSRVLDLRDIQSLRIDREVVAAWLRNFQQWAPFILFPLALGASYILRCIQALLYGGIGMVVAGLHKITLPYGAAVSAAIMAMTPFLLIDALLLFSGSYLPGWGFVGFILAMGYLVFGIRSAARRA